MIFEMAFSKTIVKEYEKRYGCIPLKITGCMISLADIETCDYLYLSDIALFEKNFAEEYEFGGLCNKGFYQYDESNDEWCNFISPGNDTIAISDFEKFYFNTNEEKERTEETTKTVEETETGINIFTMQKDFTQQILSMVSCKEELKVIEKIAKNLYEMY